MNLPGFHAPQPSRCSHPLPWRAVRRSRPGRFKLLRRGRFA